MKITIDNEWVRWGESPTDMQGFCALVESATYEGGNINVKCKYGEYALDPNTRQVTTLSGIDYHTIVEIAKYGMGYKYWERGV